MADEEDTLSKKQALVDEPNPSDEGENHDTVNQKLDDEDFGSSGDDLNSTMMAIDVASLNLDDPTSTQINIELPSDDDIIQEQLEKKKSPLERLFSKFSSSGSKTKTKGGSSKDWPKFLKPYVNVWLCDLDEPKITQIRFYLPRVLIILFSLYLHSILIGTCLEQMDSDHPVSQFYLVGFIADLVLVGLAVLFRMSPGWIVSLPLSFFSLLFAYGVKFFHASDSSLFLYWDHTIGQALNPFVGLVLAYGLLASVWLVARGLLGRVFFAVLFALGLIPVAINVYLDLGLQLSLYGPDFLSAIPSSYLQPTYLLLHGLLPVLFLSQLFLSFGSSKVPSKLSSRGFARSLCFVLLTLTVTGFAVMQKGRVTHAFNVIVSSELDVGAVEIEALNQRLKIETKNYKVHGGNDTKPRYKMNLKKGKKDNQFLLQIVDEYDYPVKNITKRDLNVYADGKPVKKYRLREDSNISYKRGTYLLTINLDAKSDLVSWDQKTKDYKDKDKIKFSISDLTMVKRLIVKEDDETFLDIKNPTKNDYSLSITYFESGQHQLSVQAYDELDQKVFDKTLDIDVEVLADVALLSPVQGDTVSDELSVLIMPKTLRPKDIQLVSYYIDDELEFESAESVFFHSINVKHLSEGAHKVSVQVKTSKATLKKTATFVKKNRVSKLSITKPSMGTFAVRQTLVEYELDKTGSGAVAGIKVYVNGALFEDYAVTGKSFELPVARWSLSEMFVSVQASLEDGTKVSDWVQINKGLGLLDLSFDTKSLGFLNYDSVNLILDASVSHLDTWHGRPKWNHVKKVVTETLVDGKLKKLNPSVVVFGHEKPYYYKSCSDFKEIVPAKQYNQTTLKRRLADVQPSGVSSLLKALKKVYIKKPGKVFVFTDSADTCRSKMKSELQKIIKKSPQTQIVVFTLGDIGAKDRRELKKMAEMTSGRFYQPNNYGILLSTFLKELELNYELYSKDELIKRDSLGSRKFRLLPGEYTLKIPYGSQQKEVKFFIENGSKTRLMITGKDKKIHVKVSESRI